MTSRTLLLGLPVALVLFAVGCASETAEDEGEEGASASAVSSTRDAVVDQARANRLAGEQATGYLAVVTDSALTKGQLAPSDLQARVQHINIQRRALYTDVAVKSHLTVSSVAESTACILFRDRVKVGEAYRTESEEWKLRTAGEAVEMPSFCVTP